MLLSSITSFHITISSASSAGNFCREKILSSCLTPNVHTYTYSALSFIYIYVECIITLKSLELFPNPTLFSIIKLGYRAGGFFGVMSPFFFVVTFLLVSSKL